MRSFFYTVITAAAAFATSSADTVELFDGKTYEGKVLSESTEEVVMDVAVNDKTRRTMSFPRLDVRSITITPQSLIDFREIETLVPTPDYLDGNDYDTRIAKVDAYLAKHGSSPTASKAKRIKKTLTEEAEKANSGQVRVGKTWFDEDDRERNQVEFDAGQDLNTAQALLANGQYAEAVILLDPFKDLYATTPSALAGSKLRTEALQRFGRSLQSMKAEHPRLIKVRDQNLDRLSARDSARLKQELDARAEAHEEATAAARKARKEWMPVDAYDLKSIETNLELVFKKLREKQPENQEPLDVAAIYRDTYTSIKSGDLNEAKRSLGQIRSARFASEYHEQLSTMLDEAEAAAKD